MAQAIASDVGTPAKRARRTQVERRAAAEGRMLHTAMQLVAENGLAALTLAAVGVAAGYSRGLPTHHFKTRAALISALTESITHSYISRVQAYASGHSPFEDLLAAVEFYLKDVRRDPVNWKSFFAVANAALTDPDAAAALSKVNARAIAAFERRIRSAMGAGQVRDDVDARAEAALILASLRGMAALILTDPRNRALARARAMFVGAVKKRLEQP